MTKMVGLRTKCAEYTEKLQPERLMIPSGAEHRQHKGSDTGNQRGVRTKHQVKDREQEGAEQIAFLLYGGQRKSLNTLSGKG